MCAVKDFRMFFDPKFKRKRLIESICNLMEYNLDFINRVDYQELGGNCPIIMVDQKNLGLFSFPSRLHDLKDM